MIAKHLSVIATLICITVLSGCASMHEPLDTDNQRLVLQRWQACIERNSTESTATLNGVQHLMEYSCEGHTRDVIATFPRHQEQQVGQLLTAFALRQALISTQNGDASAVVPVLF